MSDCLMMLEPIDITSLLGVDSISVPLPWIHTGMVCTK